MDLSTCRSSLFFSAALVLGLAATAHAGGITVDITGDENDPGCAVGDCSLREAIAAAANGDTISFALPGSPPWTITLTPGLGPLTIPVDRTNLTISGPGVASLAVNGNDAVRVMAVSTGASVTISGLTLRDGKTTSGADKHGGCVKVLGTLNLSSVNLESCLGFTGGFDSGHAGGDGGAVHVASGGTLVGDLLVFTNSAAGAGAFSSNFPGGEKGGRGGALANEGTVVLTNTTFTGSAAGNGGEPTGSGGEGGAIANLAGGVLRVDASTLSANRSGDGAVFMGVHGADGAGGALWCVGDCTLNNATLSGNAIGALGGSGTAAIGGGLAVAGGTTRLRNATVAGNTANGTGGGIAVSAGTIRPRNSLFANNTGASSQHDCTMTGAGSITSEGYNLIRVNNDCDAAFSGTDQEGTAAAPLEPVLGALAANGGPTMTRALGAGSPAIDGGDPAGCKGWNGAADFALTVDQRASARPTDGDGDLAADCDAGAFEAAGVPPVENDLHVTLAGASGGGSVSSDPAGIACPSDCDQSYAFSVTVELFAQPAADYVFTSWGGACSGSATCTFNMSADRNVTATFVALRDLTVTLGGGGSGSVASLPAGIDCPGTCSAQFVDGTEVTLTPTPGAGSYFAGWSGACTGASCVLMMTADRAATATFEPLRDLTVTLGGDGTGTVESAPAGIDCPGTCSAEFLDGDEVTLTATPAAGSLFSGWTGDCSGSACVLVMSANRAAMATFLSETLFVDGFESGGVCLWSSASGAPPCPP